jgi:hypothetical protein
MSSISVEKSNSENESDKFKNLSIASSAVVKVGSHTNAI